jgi:DNA-3-methyladenine glycosylase II
MPAPRILDENSLLTGVQHIISIDADLNASHKRIGPPPLWYRPPGFETLVYIILEQQVSLASARAAYLRLKERLPQFVPAEFLLLSDEVLKHTGFSRQKTKYCRILAEAIEKNSIILEGLPLLSDDEVRSILTKIKGIGTWTANIYLMEALLRTDIFPSNDLALLTAIQSVKKLKNRPTVAEAKQMSGLWKPWRAVAARMFWHDYLSRRNEKIGV